MDSDARFWVWVWSIVAVAVVLFTGVVAVGLYHAQLNATEQMRICAEAGMTFLDQKGNGICI